MAPIHAYLYTDPASAASWSVEQALRRPAVELGDSLELRPGMGGLAREFGPPLAIVRVPGVQETQPPHQRRDPS